MAANRQQYGSKSAQNVAGSCGPKTGISAAAAENGNEPNTLSYVTLSDKRRKAAGKSKADGEGFDTCQETQGKPGYSEASGAESGALGAREALLEADLAGWLDACPVALSDETAAGILAMVKAAGGITGQDR